jgi:hypothetical protein
MLSNILAIVEFGAQKQRIHFDIHNSYANVCNQIYSLFQLDRTKSIYRLEQQDLHRSNVFIPIDEQLFARDIQQRITNHKGNSIVRFRLVSVNEHDTVNTRILLTRFLHQ